VNPVVTWGGPLLVWGSATLAAHYALARAGLVRCSAGDWGLAFLAGYTGFTGLAQLLVLAGLPPGAPLYLAITALLAAVAAWLRRGLAPRRVDVPPWTPAERVLGVALGAVVLGTLMSALYLPPSASDAMAYTGRAKFLVAEGTLDLALYHATGLGVKGWNNLSYPALHPLAFSVTYAFGGWQVKLVTALFGLAWPLVVFGALRPRLPRFAALAWTLFLALTPEVYSHNSYALINVPAMALVLGAVVALGRSLEDGDPRHLFLAALLGAGAAGVRPDALVVLVAVGTAFLLSAGGPLGGPRRWAPGFVALALAPLLTWGVWVLYFRGVVGAASLGPVGGDETLGVGFLFQVLPHALRNTHLYGFVFLLFGLGLLVFPFAYRDRVLRFHVLAAVGVLLALTVLFGRLDVTFGGNVADLIDSSFKRALFYAVPLAGIATALSRPGRRLAALGEGWLHDGAPPETRP
jgi:hypothetical protein